MDPDVSLFSLCLLSFVVGVKPKGFVEIRKQTKFNLASITRAATDKYLQNYLFFFQYNKELFSLYSVRHPKSKGTSSDTCFV